jgi:hypothetical protein
LDEVVQSVGCRFQHDRGDVRVGVGAGARVFVVQSTPTQLKTWLATLVSTDETEIGTKQAAKLRLFDADMSQLGEVVVIMTTVKADRPGLGAQTVKASPITLSITRPGVYLIQIIIDDKVVSEWSFEVIVSGDGASPFQKAKE